MPEEVTMDQALSTLKDALIRDGGATNAEAMVTLIGGALRDLRSIAESLKALAANHDIHGPE